MSTVTDSSQYVKNGAYDPELDGLVDPDGEEACETKFANDAAMQLAILDACIKNPTVLGIVSENLSPKAFLLRGHQLIAAIAVDHYQQYGAPPTKATILHEIRQRHSEDKAIDSYLGEVVGLYNYYQPTFNPDYLADKIRELAKHDLLKRATQKWLAEQGKGKADFTPIREAMSRIDRLESKAEATAYFPDELMALPPMNWAVEKHIPEGSFSCIYGPFGTGKSFFALDALLCIAMGIPFLGRYYAKPGIICYVAGEGYSGIRKRIWAWCDKHGFDISDLKGKFLVIPRQYDLLDPTQVQSLADLTKSKLGRLPDWFCFDTLSKMFGAGDTNMPKDMGKYVNNLIRLQELGHADGIQTGVISIHHTGKDKSRGSMGASNLPGACDAMLYIDGDILKGIKVDCTKQKDGERFAPYFLVGQKVEVPITIDPSGEGTLLLDTMSGETSGDFGPLTKGEIAAIIKLADTFSHREFTWAESLDAIGQNGSKRYLSKLKDKKYLTDGPSTPYMINQSAMHAVNKFRSVKLADDGEMANTLVRPYCPEDAE